jgi:Protein of unknown function (DUF1553)/Protein of unknown function (DUF1549)/Planctomycete cytochrome C
MRGSIVLLFLLASPSFAADIPKKIEPLPADHAARMAKSADLFRSHVRDILEKSCLRCHGGKKTESEFDLGTRESLVKGGLAGPAVVPGDAKASLLTKLVTHAKEPHMPEGAAKLPEASLAKIAAWIDLGAAYDKPLAGRDSTAWTKTVVPASAKDHWAFQPLKPGRHDRIDSYVREKLAAARLAPNATADKRTLIRRVSYDLIGLPPTPEEVEAFEKDASPEAYAKLIDRLLASDHYGERWARHWLDLVRFGESHGFEHDYDRPTAFHYRDFVIKALNRDLPYTTFAKWQIAGDEFAPNDPLALTATGYLAAGVHSTQITANEVARHRYDELDDIVNNIGTTFLGLSIGCARCHDHKFDPIPSRDYYRMVSAFTTTIRADVDVDFDPVGYQKARIQFEREHSPLVEAVRRYEGSTLKERFAEWEAAAGAKPIDGGWIYPSIVEHRSAGGATLAIQADGSVLLGGKNPNTETLTFRFKAPANPIQALRLEALSHASLVKGGPGRASNGNFALSDVALTTAKGTKVRLFKPQSTFEQKGLPASATIDDNANSAWAVDPQFGKDHAVSFEVESPFPAQPGELLTLTLKFNNNTGHGMGRPRIGIATADKRPELTAVGLPAAIPEALATPAAKRTPEQAAKLLAWFAPQDRGWAMLDASRTAHLAKAPKPRAQKALISTEGIQAVRLHTQGEDFLKETHFLRRGDPMQTEGIATPSYLQILMPASESESLWRTAPPAGSRTSFQRSALAEWLTDTERGAGRLFARVIVNRLWQKHFGRGIVSTVSDFGKRGEPPTHPELLDFLASELIRNGWRLKPIHKLILSSETYRQSSVTEEARLKADPDNRLLSRYPIRRLDAEAIRDGILAVSGRLDRTMYGPGTLSEDMKRRSVYFTMKRSKLIASLTVFDAPDGTVGIGERSNTTIAPQALHLMNNPQVRAAAKSMAGRVLAADGTEAAVARAYRLALARDPTTEERAAALEFLGTNPSATMAEFCQILLCLNEFVYLE